MYLCLVFVDGQRLYRETGMLGRGSQRGCFRRQGRVQLVGLT